LWGRGSAMVAGTGCVDALFYRWARVPLTTGPCNWAVREPARLSGIFLPVLERKMFLLTNLGAPPSRQVGADFQVR